MGGRWQRSNEEVSISWPSVSIILDFKSAAVLLRVILPENWLCGALLLPRRFPFPFVDALTPTSLSMMHSSILQSVWESSCVWTGREHDTCSLGDDSMSPLVAAPIWGCELVQIQDSFGSLLLGTLCFPLLSSKQVLFPTSKLWFDEDNTTPEAPLLSRASLLGLLRLPMVAESALEVVLWMCESPLKSGMQPPDSTFPCVWALLSGSSVILLLWHTVEIVQGATMAGVCSPVCTKPPPSAVAVANV